MIISTKGRYALRIMIDLANHQKKTVRLKDIAMRQEISEKYMEQVMCEVRAALKAVINW